ncbi:MAG: hypothetical protein WCT54_05490 [Patescibacteria group bacterium]
MKLLKAAMLVDGEKRTRRILVPKRNDLLLGNDVVITRDGRICPVDGMTGFVFVGQPARCIDVSYFTSADHLWLDETARGMLAIKGRAVIAFFFDDASSVTP